MSTFHTGPVNPWPALPKASDEQLAALREAMRRGPPMPLLPMPEPVQTTFYGFFHTDCIFESAAAMVSLHRTKAGAYRAMRLQQWQAWEELQREQRTPRKWGLGRERGHKAYVHEASHIRAVEVQP